MLNLRILGMEFIHFSKINHIMFCISSLKDGASKRLISGILLTAGSVISANAQEDKPNAIVNYGEDHPAVFIIGILVAVSVAVFLVYFIFKRSSKENSSGSFSKPVNKGHMKSSHDRRYAGTKRPAVNSGGFTRK
jgi:hypothetical protein